MRERGEVFQRLDELMKRSGKMEKELIEYIGLPAGTFSQWRRGNGDSYLRYIKEICEFFKVTPNYLFFFFFEIPESLCSKDEADLLDCYRKVGNREKSYIRVLAHEMLK